MHFNQRYFKKQLLMKIKTRNLQTRFQKMREISQLSRAIGILANLHHPKITS